MFILAIYAFLAGLVTILSPCILPLLPLILSTSVVNGGYRRPLGVIVGFVTSFTLATLFLATLVSQLGIPADGLRYGAVMVIAILGIALILPQFQALIERVTSRLSNLAPSTTGRHGLLGGLFIGASLGLLWTPCVGPILASVIALALTGQVTGDTFIITLSYSLGTALPMLAIMLSGSYALQRLPWLARRLHRIQQFFGVVMIATALAIFFGLDRQVQSYLLTKFPRYGVGLTKLEDNPRVEQALGGPTSTLSRGLLAPALITGGEWFNSHPLMLESLRGKVVLLDFWTYTCINCQRTLPYLKTWYQEYAGQGLVILGIHTPEFEFEKDPKNVLQALDDFGITYPVMQDNNFATWNAYHNRYWPAKYLIDKDGYVRYTHFGEGDYDETEKAIRQLLGESGAKVEGAVSNPSYTNYARTPETYLGDARRVYSPDLSFVGNWLYSQESATPSIGSSLSYLFEAKSVYLVMRSKNGKVAKVTVYLDGVEQKEVLVTKSTLYTLVDLDRPGSHLLKLEFGDDNLELFAFTFG